MTREEKDQYIRDNTGVKTNQQMADVLDTSEASIRRAKKRMKSSGNQETSPDSIDSLHKMIVDGLKENDIDISRVEGISKIGFKNWQMGSKDAEGNPQVTDLSAQHVQLDLSIKEPLYPVMQQAPPIIIKPAHQRKANSGKFKTAVILPDPQIGFWRDIETDELTPYHPHGR